jgi:hypothetical protein
MADDAVDALTESLLEEGKLSFTYEPGLDALHGGDICEAYQVGLGCIPYPKPSASSILMMTAKSILDPKRRSTHVPKHE